MQFCVKHTHVSVRVLHAMLMMNSGPSGGEKGSGQINELLSATMIFVNAPTLGIHFRP
jgi:hypothetical protein